MSLRKLDIGGPFRGFFQQHMARNNFEWLSISVEHLDIVSSLPFHHKDPFDRLLVAQAITEKIPIVSADNALDLYAINRVG